MSVLGLEDGSEKIPLGLPTTQMISEHSTC